MKSFFTCKKSVISRHSGKRGTSASRIMLRDSGQARMTGIEISYRHLAGFSLVELILIISIVAILLGFITINLAGVQHRATLNSVVQNLISDVRQQQIKAMVGDSEGRASADSYGVHVDSNQYVLFHGTSYSAADASNFTISLPTTMQFVSPGSDIIFSKISGEIAAAVSLQLQNTANSNTKTIEINRYGVTTSVN